MIGGVTRQGGQPGLPDWVTLPAGVKFFHVNVSRWGNPNSRDRIRDTSNSRKIHSDGGFAPGRKRKEGGKPFSVTSATIIFFQMNFSQTSPSFKQIFW